MGLEKKKEQGGHRERPTAREMNSETLLQAGCWDSGPQAHNDTVMRPFTTSCEPREKSGSLQVGVQAGIEGSCLFEWAEHGKQGQYDRLEAICG